MTPLRIESWVWFSIVVAVAIARFVSRWMTLGSVRRYQADDYVMVLVLCFYTAFLVTINIVANTSSNLFPPGFDVSTLTAADKARREYGSKLILVVEECQIVSIWGAKACLLILYLRLTTLRWQHIAIQVLAAYVGIAFVVMEILYLGVWCRPFHEYWAVPTNSSQCNAATNHLITNATFNLSSDLIMLAVALPIFLRMHLPWRKKIPVVGVFSLGIFVVLAAILNKVYSFSDPFGSLWTYWYVRESSTAILVANLPFVWKLISCFLELCGIRTSVSGSHTATKASLSISGNDRSRRGTDQDFIPHWPTSGKEGLDLERGLRKKGTASRGMTLEEFMRDDGILNMNALSSRNEEKRALDQSTGSTTTPKAILNNTPPQDTIRRESDPEAHNSSAPASTIPSVAGSWSAKSFV
ncbi:hypothetical protein HII31_08875 [Pseudocercospora fuligena]|uniref:Rhodopsin domain-containing protein n=1 Tax=Pseudocercospora fuligena TaxID=685502 RepID=A0A8H6RER9_9PEZI|nr:hypothetical protein HII31_08875 [Pseudocercospora fuligena]